MSQLIINSNSSSGNNSSPSVQDLMNLLNEQSKVINGLQKTIENLNETIKNLKKLGGGADLMDLK